MRKSDIKFIKCEEMASYPSQYLKSTALDYKINYRPDSYDVVATYDILFFPGKSSTNGATTYIHGKYGEVVKSEEGYLRGTEYSRNSGSLVGAVTSNIKFYITGVINEPTTEEIRQQNNRALSIHVEENYVIDYSK